MNKKGKIALISLLIAIPIIIILLTIIIRSEEPEPQSTLWSRTATTETYRNPDGTMTVTQFSDERFMDLGDERGIPNFVEINSTYFPITTFNATAVSSPYNLYSYKMSYYSSDSGKDEEELDNQYTTYKAYFRNNSNTVGAVRFEKDGYYFIYDLSGGEMVWAVKPGQPAATDTLGGGAPSNSQNTQINVSGGVAIYPRAFYNTNVTYELTKNMMKENFILTGLPSYKDYLYLRYSGTVEFNKSLNVCANDICYTPTGSEDDFETEGIIEFQNNLGEAIFSLPAPIIMDSAGHSITGKYRFMGSNAHGIFYLYINKTFLQNAVYPVYIDPTISIPRTHIAKDGPVNNNSRNTNYAGYGIQIGLIDNQLLRSYISMNLSNLYQVGSVYNFTSALLLFKNYTTGGIGDPPNNTMNASLHVVYNDWINGTGNNILNETQLNWNNQPCGTDSTELTNDTNCNLTAEDITQPNKASNDANLTFNIINSISNSYNNSKLNISFVLKTTIESSVRTTNAYSPRESTNGPSITITYTPYINIISPTESQIFTQDSPTALLNISTAVNMTTCYYNNGTNNFTMASLNTTYFYNSTAGLQYLDSSAHQVTFYCNQSDDGTWRTSDTVNFEVDSVNITRCRDLTVANRNYSLINNITTSLTNCLVFLNSSMTLNGNYNNITSTADYSTSADGVVVMGQLARAYDGNTLNNIKVYSYENLGAINIHGESNIIFNSTFYTEGSSGRNAITFDAGSSNITNSEIYAIGGDYRVGIGDGVNDPSSGIFVKDSKINSSHIAISWGTSTNPIINFINVSYLNGTEFVGPGDILTRQWYFDSNVSDTTAGGPVASVNITIKDIDGNVVLSLLTDENGDINRQELNEYINTGGTIAYKTPHNVSISKTGYYTNSTLINITSLNNVFYETNIKKASVGVNIVSPANQTYNNRTVYFNVTVDKDISLCRYTVNNWTNNYSMTSFNASYYSASNTSVAEGSITAKFWCNDTDSNVNSTEFRYFSVDVTPPSISYNSNTETNNAYISRTSIFINVTASDNAKDTVRLDWSTEGNNTFDNSGGNYYWENKTGLTNGVYTFYAWANDSAGNFNATTLRTVTIDTIKPSMVFKEPLNITYNANVSKLNYTYSDTNPSSCWYSRNIGVTNSTAVTAGINWSNVISIEGSNNYTLFCNDSASNINSTTIYFFKDTVIPLINMVYPTNTTYNYAVIDINFTSSDLNSNACWYSTNNGGTNTSITCGTNKTGLSSSEGTNIWLVGINDTSGNVNTSKITFFRDTIYPTVSISYPSNNSNFSYVNPNVNYTISESNIGSCKWSKDSGTTNTTITCGNNITGQTFSEGANTVIVWVNDTAGNSNYTTISFNIDTTFPLISFGTGTEDSGTNYSRTNIYTNTSWTEAKFKEITFSLYNLTLSDNKLTIWDPMDDNHTTHLDAFSSNKYVVSGAAYTPSGKLGGAYNFDGINDYINLSTSLIDFENGTISVWFYPKQGTADQIIVWSGNNYDSEGELPNGWGPANETGIAFGRTVATFSGFLAGTNGECAVEGTSAISLNTWHHGVLVWNATTQLIYIDGILNKTAVCAVKPRIGFTDTFIGRPLNNSRYANGTIDEVKVYNRTLTASEVSNLYNYRLINQTTFTTAVYALNWTGLPDNKYSYNVHITDLSGNVNYTSTRIIILDNTAPTVTIEHPKAQSYVTTNFSLNYTVSDAMTAVSTCWFKVENSSVALMISNITIPCTNTTFNLSIDGNYNLTFYANDSMNKLTTKIVAFSLSSSLPSVVLDSPKEGEWLKTTSITFNFTVTDAHTLSNNCSLWGDWTGTYHKNYTWSIPNSGIQNYTTVVLTEGGLYKYNVLCNESNGLESFALTNVSFGIDQTFPTLSIVTPANQTYNTIISTLNYKSADTNPGSCWYSQDGGDVNSSSVAAGINFTGIISTEGNNTYTLFCNDSANNINSTIINFFQDTVQPDLSIVYPTNITYNINISNFNFTISELNLGACIWGRDGWATNTTITCGTNASNTISVEGNNTYLVWTNDTSGNANQKTVTFFKDTILPGTKIIYPTNTTYSTTITILNYTYSDTSPDSCWYSTDFGATNSSSVAAGINFTTITSTEGSNNWTIYCNDTSNNVNITTFIYFTLDSTLPAVVLVYPTQSSNYNINVSNLNFTYTDTNPGSCWYSRDNGANNFTSVLAGINFSNVQSVEGNNSWTLWCNDTVNNLNITIISLNKDTIFPQINMTYPNNITYAIEVLYLNYTFSDINPGSCWYSRDMGISNSSIADAGFNFSYITSIEGSNNWTLFCNDSYGNLNSSLRYFYKDTIPPELNITYPANITYIVNVSNLNYTISDVNIQTCKWSRDGWITNTTVTCGNNVSNMISVEDNNTYLIWVNDTSGNAKSQTVTFFKDTILPEIVIIEPANETFYSLYAILINLNVSANYSDISTYIWSQNDGSNNHTFTPNTTMSWDQPAFSTFTYTIAVWVNDTHNNWAKNTTRITVETTYSGGGGGGGGGSKVVTVEKIIQVGTQCGNDNCEEGENFANCPEDCGQNFDTLLANCFSSDPAKQEKCLWKEASALTWSFILAAAFISIYIGRSLYIKYKSKQKNRRLNNG